MTKLEKVIDGKLYFSEGDGWKLAEGPEADYVALFYKMLQAALELEKTVSRDRIYHICDLCETALETR